MMVFLSKILGQDFFCWYQTEINMYTESVYEVIFCWILMISQSSCFSSQELINSNKFQICVFSPTAAVAKKCTFIDLGTPFMMSVHIGQIIAYYRIKSNFCSIFSINRTWFQPGLSQVIPSIC